MKDFFKLQKHHSNPKTEILAGLTTFMTMAYIIVVNPAILADAGMPHGAAMTATILGAVIATVIMAFYANLPFALAPGMGLNAFFAYTVCLGMGKSWQFALTAVFLAGLVFLGLTLLNIRELIINSIPPNLKKAISAGIGILIAVIGLNNAGVIEQGPALLQIGNIAGGGGPTLAILGIFISTILLIFNLKGALFLGIALTTLLGIPMGVTDVSTLKNIISLPDSIAPVFLAFDFSQIFTADMAIVVFTIVFLNLFDTMGTLVGVATKIQKIDAQGHIPFAKKAFVTDALGTILGAMVGTSPVVTYVESASGVAQGGRTGLTALTVAVLFGIALFFLPLFMIIPAAATAPALVLVGLFMITPLAEINFTDFTEAVPAFLTFLMMPLSYSISNGIAFGIISYALLKLLTGKGKQVKPITWILALFFIFIQLYFSH